MLYILTNFLINFSSEEVVLVHSGEEVATGTFVCAVNGNRIIQSCVTVHVFPW